jgi:hypothetical protein
MHSTHGGHHRIVSLCKEIETLVQEVTAGEARLARVIAELHEVTRAAPTRHRGLEVVGASPHLLTLEILRPYKGELTERILSFLSANAGTTFRTPAIARALGVLHRQKAVYMNLVRLSQKGRILKVDSGFTALGGRVSPSLRLG